MLNLEENFIVRRDISIAFILDEYKLICILIFDNPSWSFDEHFWIKSDIFPFSIIEHAITFFPFPCFIVELDVAHFVLQIMM